MMIRRPSSTTQHQACCETKRARRSAMSQQHEWWQKGIIYQIYPRSFHDSNGDGIGDLPGILSRLVSLTWLGLDAVLLSPISPSPMADFGYYISDYTGVDP